MREKGFTLVEVLVAAFILVVAGLTAAGIYVRAAQRLRMYSAAADASALAEAVRLWAKDNLDAGTTRYSQEVSGLPSDPARGTGLVWKLEAGSVPADGTSSVYPATLFVALDDDGDGKFDEEDFQRAEVAVFGFLFEDE